MEMIGVMRNMLLSLRPDVYEDIRSGRKIYEYRKVFPDELIKAYIYVSRPVQALEGYMILGNKTSLLYWRGKYSYDQEAQERINQYLKRYKYAMEIQEFQATIRISLNELRTAVPKFLIPQMYYFIDDSDLLLYLEKNLKPIEDKITHDFSEINSNKICLY